MNSLDEGLKKTENLRGLVHGLPEDQVSLQWRSELNEKIFAMAAKPRRSLVSILWKPVSGLAAMGAVAFVMFANAPQVSKPSSNSSHSEFTAAIIDAHEASYAYREIGVTMPHGEGQPLINLVDRSEEVDLGAL
jgi:hypothetical protein